MSQNLWATIMPFEPLAGLHFRHCEGITDLVSTTPKPRVF